MLSSCYCLRLHHCVSDAQVINVINLSRQPKRTTWSCHIIGPLPTGIAIGVRCIAGWVEGKGGDMGAVTPGNAGGGTRADQPELMMEMEWYQLDIVRFSSPFTQLLWGDTRRILRYS